MAIRYRILALSSALLVTTSAVGQVPDADPRIAELTVQVETLTRERDELRRELERKGLPAAGLITSVRVTPSDDRAHFQVELSDISRVMVNVQADDEEAPRPFRSTGFLRNHIVVADGLRPGTRYRAEVVVLESGSAMERTGVVRQGMRPTEASTYDPNLSFSTMAADPPPQVLLGTAQPQHNSLTLVGRAGKPVLVRAAIYSVDAAGNRAQTAFRTEGADFTLNEVGRPRNRPVSADWAITLLGLEPGKEYSYRVEAMDESGQTATLIPEFTRVITPSAPARFDFTGPLNVVIDPVRGLTVRWNSTTPASSARLLTSFAPATDEDDRSRVATIDGTQLAATIGYLDLLQASVAAPAPSGAPATTPPPPPILTVEMTGVGGETRSLQLTFGIKIPTVQEARTTAGLTDPQRRSLERVARATDAPDDDDKFRWEDLVVTGLKFLVPVVF